MLGNQPFVYKRGTHWEGANRMEYNNIQELVKKIDCWRFWGYCLVASYQYYRICATFMIKRQRWADVHHHLTRLFPAEESTPPQEVLARLRSRRRALRKIETCTWSCCSFSVTVEPSSVGGFRPPSCYLRRKRVRR